MSDLVAVVFDDESTAFEMRAALVKMQREYLLEHSTEETVPASDLLRPTLGSQCTFQARVGATTILRTASTRALI